MPQRLSRFLVVLMLVLFQVEMKGQDFSIVPGKPLRYTRFIEPDFGFRLLGHAPVAVSCFLKTPSSQVSQPVFSVLQVIAPSAYADRLGLICRQELKFENKTGLPLRIRLGSIDYVNWMESKPGAIKPR